MFERELERLRNEHLLRRPVVVERHNGPYATIEGREVLLMCSNDYLGLSRHPMIKEAARSSLDVSGFGSGASRLVSGTSVIHRELEARIAAFKRTEAAVLFNSGYAANTGVIPAVAGEGDAILSDSLNHASIVDGCRLSRARVMVYRHRDMDHLDGLLAEAGEARRRLIVTDGVFSMDGDLAPLPDIVRLADKYGAMVMVDEAHAVGVFGKTGRGVVEHYCLEDHIHIRIGTLGKAFGSFGAYAACDGDAAELLVNRARSYIYSTALPPSVCAASMAALEIVERETGLRTRLWDNRERTLAGLKRLGLGFGNSESPIIPLLVGDSERAMEAGRRLFAFGIYAPAIRPPTVPEGTARIRMTLSAIHSHRDVDFALAALYDLKKDGLLQ
jgi:8-amino-7-oxononanoate synthase